MISGTAAVDVVIHRVFIVTWVRFYKTFFGAGIIFSLAG